MGTLWKINAIFLNIKINRLKLVLMCRYKLATYWQNFTEIHLIRVKILQKVLGGLLFWLTLYSQWLTALSNWRYSSISRSFQWLTSQIRQRYTGCCKNAPECSTRLTEVIDQFFPRNSAVISNLRPLIKFSPVLTLFLSFVYLRTDVIHEVRRVRGVITGK